MTERFIFSRDNHWLKKYYNCWKKKKKFGTFILIGASGSGKSVFLKQLVEELGLEYCMYSGEEIETLLLKSVRKYTNIQIEVAPVLIIEDIDRLIKSPSMRAKFEEFVRQYEVDENRERRLILMTAIDFMAFQLDGYAIPVNPLHIDLRAVIKKAKQYGIKLSASELWELSRCKRVSQLEEKLRNIKISNIRNGNSL